MLSYLRQLPVEFYLNNFAPRPVLANPSWQVQPSQLKDVFIRWPKKYEWEPAKDWVNILLYGFRRHVKVEMADDIPQPYKGTVVFQVVISGKTRNVAIGYSDYAPADEDCAKQCDLYFKMQYARNGYANFRIIPGGYVPDSWKLYFYLKDLRKLRDKKQFRYDVHGRFGINKAQEIRKKAVNILQQQKSFRFEGGMKTIPYKEFLKEIAQSKICIDLPGQGDFCFRLMNYMAIGTCIIAYPHRAILHAPLINRKHIIYVKEDFSDLVELCEYYLQNEEEREHIARNNREFFDFYLHKDNLVKYYLETCLHKLR